MSNKAVPTVYRTIIDSVIENVRPDFDELGVEEAVLQELLRSWEHKVAISRVADFSGDPVMAPAAREFPPLPNPPPFHPRSRPSSSTTHTANAKSTTSAKDSNEKATAAEDEINSDLDDPDDEDPENDDETTETGDVIIALYEKVQRVKNKWKITLKDGLISVGGKDYLFGKCSGEFEW